LSPKTVKFGDHDLLKQQQALFAFPQQQQRSESEQAIILFYFKKFLNFFLLKTRPQPFHQVPSQKQQQTISQSLYTIPQLGSNTRVGGNFGVYQPPTQHPQQANNSKKLILIFLL